MLRPGYAFLCYTYPKVRIRQRDSLAQFRWVHRNRQVMLANKVVFCDAVREGGQIRGGDLQPPSRPA